MACEDFRLGAASLPKLIILNNALIAATDRTAAARRFRCTMSRPAGRQPLLRGAW
jgi:hypothetical protein